MVASPLGRVGVGAGAVYCPSWRSLCRSAVCVDGWLGGWVFVSHLGWAAGGGGGGVCGSHNGYSETFALLWQTNDNGEDDDDGEDGDEEEDDDGVDG